MVAMCAMMLPIVKTKLEIAELMLEHGAWTWRMAQPATTHIAMARSAMA